MMVAATTTDEVPAVKDAIMKETKARLNTSDAAQVQLSNEEESEKMDQNASTPNETSTELTMEQDKKASSLPSDRKNPEIKQRGQRMFGVLLGTLNKFKEETKIRSDADKKRSDIDKRLLEKLNKEKQELQAAVKKEEEERKQRTLAQRNEARKSYRIQAYKSWNAQTRNLSTFLKTKTGPSIYYLPAKFNAKTTQLLQEISQPDYIPEDQMEEMAITAINTIVQDHRQDEEEREAEVMDTDPFMNEERRHLIDRMDQD